MFILVIVLGGCATSCISGYREAARAQDWCAAAATATQNLIGGDRSDWRLAYQTCMDDPSEPWNRN